MKFTPKSERELAEEGLIPDGTVCDFEVVEAEDAISKAGNEMIALRLKVWRPNGSTTTVRDWLVSNLQGKVFAFAKAVGMREAYDAGQFDAADLVGKCGTMKVGIEPEKDGFPARNRAASYVAAEQASAPVRGAGPAPRRVPASVDGDEIPFAAEWRG